MVNGLNGSGPNKGVGEGPDKAGKLKKCGYAPNCFSSDAPGEGTPSLLVFAWGSRRGDGDVHGPALKRIGHTVRAGLACAHAIVPKP
jgi:hypothetical protein